MKISHVLSVLLTAATAVIPVHAAILDVTSMRHAGPYALTLPVLTDSVDLASKAFDVKSLLSNSISLDLVKNADVLDDSVLTSTAPSLHLLGFSLDNSRFASCSIKVDGLKNYELYIDGQKSSGAGLSLTPRTRDVVIKCLTDGSAADTVKVTVDTPTPDVFTVNPAGGRRFSTSDMFTGRSIGAATLSPSGKYLLTYFYSTEPGGKRGPSLFQITDVATGRVVSERNSSVSWMPSSDRLYYTREKSGKTQLVTVDPVTGREETIAREIPSSRFTISPTETFALFNDEVEGPKEKNPGLYRIINPEDRQPGWRDRGNILKYDFATGITSPLTFGYSNPYFSNLSADGTKLVFTVSESVMGKRPTNVSSLYLLDLTTMNVDTIVKRDGFLASALISPDGRTVAVKGSPEAFGGVGKNLPDGMTPNSYEYELFLVDVASHEVRPVTRDFHPSVGNMRWSRADGNLYFVAEHRDYIPLYRLDVSSGRIDALPVSEDIVQGFSLANDGRLLAYYGQSPDNASRVYTMDTRKLSSVLRHDLYADRVAGIDLDKTVDWTYISTTFGDTIYARYNLPPDFDPQKKYPMIVYYYGGCSPVNRYYNTTYNPHLFASHGYISLVINPSGATGRGQEFAARHVATAGQGVAQDIIDGVKAFAAEHPWVDAAKIGCCGASYGGFMTQWLQTQTDIFAAAISHAGISDHTSYWGEGYWGYSYSECSMADKYPWVDRELYVNNSPLYNADKIHTPLLFLHGDADTNVPIGESIQMFTALKLLGRPTEFVAVKDQNHHILDFDKRERWLNTIMAWFARYLQDDPTWWNSMYDSGVLD